MGVVCAGVVSSQTERFELEGNLKFFGAGNGIIFADGTKQLSVPTSEGRVLDSLNQEVGFALPNDRLTRYVNGRWILLQATEIGGFLLQNTVKFYYSTADCTGTRHVSAGSLMAIVQGIGTTFYVPGPAARFSSGSTQTLSPSPGPCTLASGFDAGPVTEFDVSGFVPPFRGVL